MKRMQNMCTVSYNRNVGLALDADLAFA